MNTETTINGSLDICYKSGVGYLNGIYGYEKNPEKGLALITQAADAGHLSAQRLLGALYFAGDKIAKNPGLAVYWYSKAAEQGDS